MTSNGKKEYGLVKEAPFIEGSDEEKVWGQAVMQAISGYTSTRYTKEGKTEAMSSRIVAQRSVEIADLVLMEFKERRQLKKSLPPKKD